MTCVICNRFSDEPLCDSCRLLVEQSTFRHRFSSRCPVCGRPVEDSAYPCRWCSDHLGGFTDAYGPVSSLVSRFQNGRGTASGSVVGRSCSGGSSLSSNACPTADAQSDHQKNGI
ncbi:MAG: hypothetical protein LKE28_00465 [Sphaerochaeta sp.]|nr:hypothetical protein [Sphaerochaeta sp.]